MAIHKNLYGHDYIRCTNEEIEKALKRWGSSGMAARKLGMTSDAIRERLRSINYKQYLRKPPVITSEFNEYVMRPW